jgi:hypothetical protein
MILYFRSLPLVGSLLVTACGSGSGTSGGNQVPSVPSVAVDIGLGSPGFAACPASDALWLRIGSVNPPKTVRDGATDRNQTVFASCRVKAGADGNFAFTASAELGGANGEFSMSGTANLNAASQAQAQFKKFGSIFQQGDCTVMTTQANAGTLEGSLLCAKAESISAGSPSACKATVRFLFEGCAAQ